MSDFVRQGSFSEISFSKLFYSISGQGLTGVLNVVDQKDQIVRKRLYFLGGDSAFVKYGPMEECLGQILILKGMVTEEQLEEAMDQLALSPGMIGETLIAQGYMDQKQLEAALQYQAEEKIISCFSWTDGLFTFDEETVATFDHDVPLYKVRPEHIIYEGVNRHYSLEQVEKEFEHLKDKGLKLKEKYDQVSAKFHFTPEQAKLIHDLDHQAAGFGRFIGSSDLGLTQTLKLLYILVVTDLVEISEAPGLSSFKEPEQTSIRRERKIVELPEPQPDEQAVTITDGGTSFFEEDKDASFSDAVTDYLTDKIESEDQPADGAQGEDEKGGELTQFGVDEQRMLVKREISNMLQENRREALDAYMTGHGDGGLKFGEMMVTKELIDNHQLTEAIQTMRSKGGSLLTNLSRVGAIDDDDLHEFLSDYYKVPAVDIKDIELDQDVVSLISEELSKKYKAIPINRTGNTLIVAMVNPQDIQAIDEIQFLTEYNIEVVVCTENQIDEAIDKYHDSAAMLDDVMMNFDDSDIDLATTEDDFDLADVTRASEGAPVVKLVNHLFVDAILKEASDVHFEPYETAFRVRYRIDGVLYHVLNPPLKLRTAVSSRIKIMAKLDIAERRLPQDGRMSLRVGKDRKIDFRVSTLPTIWGEKVVCRLLDKSSLELDLTKLGLEQKQLDDFRWAIYQPYGMILVTGPSGSGKTTTLYSALLELNKITENISTAEDPIEYYLEGINQVQMHDEIGLNFAYTLRSFLRQDPDIIMVGEIRDFETAEIAVKAALTGHVVLTTVHTNDAPSTINRLLNMGIEPFLITAAVRGVLSQRLVRKLCPECLEPAENVPRQNLLDLGVHPDIIDGFQPYESSGCSNCSDRGFKGRIALYEVMTIRGELPDYILAGATPTELKNEAMRMGMKTMRQTGLTKVNDKVTTLGEVTRATMPDYVKKGSSDDDY